MFRLQGLPQIDPAEEKRRVRDGVMKNVYSFLALCVTIRLGITLNCKRYSSRLS